MVAYASGVEIDEPEEEVVSDIAGWSDDDASSYDSFGKATPTPLYRLQTEFIL